MPCSMWVRQAMMTVWQRTKKCLTTTTRFVIVIEAVFAIILCLTWRSNCRFPPLFLYIYIPNASHLGYLSHRRSCYFPTCVTPTDPTRSNTKSHTFIPLPSQPQTSYSTRTQNLLLPRTHCVRVVGSLPTPTCEQEWPTQKKKTYTTHLTKCLQDCIGSCHLFRHWYGSERFWDCYWIGYVRFAFVLPHQVV